MTKIDPNRLIFVLLVIALASIAAVSGYRLEIAAIGLRFEENHPTGPKGGA